MEKMKIFRAADVLRRGDPEVVQELAPAGQAPTYPSPLPELAQIGITRLMDAGIEDGNVIKLLFSAPGFSLTYVWFKAHFPLARHRHNTACLYYVVSGDVKFGREQLGPGDGLFLPADTFYTFEIGSEGVEFLEFRHTSHYDYYFSGGTEAFWDRAVKAVVDNREAWKQAVPPVPAA